MKAILENIKYCMIHTVKLSIVYRKADGSESQRSVEPYEIKGAYLFGFDGTITKDGKPQIKQFKLDSIVSSNVTEDKFNPKWEIKP